MHVHTLMSTSDVICFHINFIIKIMKALSLCSRQPYSENYRKMYSWLQFLDFVSKCLKQKCDRLNVQRYIKMC